MVVDVLARALAASPDAPTGGRDMGRRDLSVVRRIRHRGTGPKGAGGIVMCLTTRTGSETVWILRCSGLASLLSREGLTAFAS
jgi:hypothetical protein